jgi:nucleotide-binding universal stress UspA family protein
LVKALARLEVVEMARQKLADLHHHVDDVVDEASDSSEAKAPPFRRMLVAIDESKAAQGAVDFAAEWVGEHGAEVRFLEVTEEHTQRRGERESDVDPIAGTPARHLAVAGPTLGARNRRLVHDIAEAAQDFGADLIVLGFDRPRLARHRLAPSLRAQLVRVTDLPVLVTPRPDTEAKWHHRLVPDLRRNEERAQAPRGYAHV